MNSCEGGGKSTCQQRHRWLYLILFCLPLIDVFTSDLKAQTIVVSPETLTLTEDATDPPATHTTTFNVSLSQEPTGNNDTTVIVSIIVANSYRNSITVNGGAGTSIQFGRIASGSVFKWDDPRPVKVTAIQDNNIKGESFNEMITLSSSAIFGGNEYNGLSASVGVTVTDDDDPPLVDFRQSTSTVNEADAGTVNVVVDLAPSPAFDTDLKYTVGGTATEGTTTTGDFYITGSGTVLATGATTEIDVVIRDDNTFEGNETIILTLTSDAEDNYDLRPNGPGVYHVHTITITDNDMPTNNAPTVVGMGIPDQTATTGTPFNPNIVAYFTDADTTDTLTYTATKGDGTDLPNWLTLSTTGAFSGSPGATDTGTITVRVTANDGNGGTVYDDFDLVVSKPEVNITRDAVSVTEGAMASFTVTRTGPTTAALEVLLSVSEETGDDFVDDTLEVNTMVSIPIGSSSAKFTVATTGDSTDEPNGSVTVALLNSANYTRGISYAASVTVNDDDLPLVSITPGAAVTEGTAATFTVARVGVTTGALTVLLAVSEETTQGQDFVADGLEGNDKSVVIQAGDSDVSYTVATTPDTTDEEHGHVTVAIRPSAANYRIDPAKNDADVTVNDNDDPDPTTPVVSITRDASSVAEGTTASFTVTRTLATTVALIVNLEVSEETDGGQDFVANTLEGSKTVTIPIGSSSAKFTVATTGDSTDEPDGEVTVKLLAASNSSGVYTTSNTQHTAMITVTDNDLPEVSITAGATVTEGTPASFTLSRIGDTTEALTVLLAVSEDNAGGQEFVANGLEGTDKSFDIPAGDSDITYSVPTTPDTTDEPNGKVTVLIRADATNYRIDSAKNDADVTVNDNDGTTTNTAPTVANAIPDLTATVGTAFSYAFPTTTFTDPDGDSLTYSVTTKPTWLNYAANTRTFSVTPLAAHTGTHTVTVSASDGTLSVTDSFDLTVSATPPPNRPPTVANAIPDQAATVGSPFSYAWQTSTFSDADDDSLSYTVTKPSWLTYTSNTRTFSVTPQTAHIGTHTITVSASDGTLSVTDSFDLTVGTTPPTNTAPTVANAIPDKTATPGTLFSLNISGNFTDADGDTLTYSATQSDGSALPSWLILSPAGVFTGIPLEDFTSATIIVTATDPDGEIARAEFTIGQPSEGTSDSLVRFGRTLGVQAVNTITDRLSSPRQIGLTGQVAGQSLVNGQRPNPQQNTLSTNPPNHTPGGADPLGEETTMATDTLQTGTAFTYTEETPNGTKISYWGQGTRSSFASESITDGKVTTLAFGTDWQKDQRTYGLMITRSSGDISYRQGSIERTMTTRMRAIIPYGGMDLANNLSLWGAFGLGQGELTLKPLDDNGDEQTTDLDWQMVASGLRGDLSSIELLPGAELGWRADALWTRTSSDEQEGLPATRSKSTRLRVGLEMGWNHQLASSTMVRPYMGFDLLYDGGDAETGLGVDVSGGVDWFNPAKGLTVGLSGHKVIHHVDDAYESWGLSFSLAYDPRPDTKEGFSAVVSHAVDREEVVGTDSLLGTTPDMDNPVTMDRSWQMEAAYGTARAEGMVGSSYTRVRGSDDPEDLRVGYRIEPDTAIAEDLTVDTWASSPLEDGVASNAAGVDLVWRW